MQRLLAAGRLALVLGLSVILVACGQFQVLKARKAFKEANAFYQQQDYKRAAAKYEEVIAADPSLTVALFYLGNSYDQLYKPARQGEPENDAYLTKAMSFYQQAIDNTWP